jgi:hypothetical protein
MSFGTRFVDLSKQNFSTGVLSNKLGHIRMYNISGVLRSCMVRVCFLRILAIDLESAIQD